MQEHLPIVEPIKQPFLETLGYNGPISGPCLIERILNEKDSPIDPEKCNFDLYGGGLAFKLEYKDLVTQPFYLPKDITLKSNWTEKLLIIGQKW